MDFPTLLVLATLISGLIWALDAWVFAPRRRAAAGADGTSPKEPLTVEYARSFFPVLLIVLLIRSFVVEPFRIPSGSMMPTLLVGDFILVNKFSYGLRLPVLHTRVLNLGSPERGDIAVFRYPENPRIDYIKRIVGVPGDQIEYRDKVLYVNGEALPQQYQGSYVGTGAGSVMTGARLLSEQLDDNEYQILVVPGAQNHHFEFTVPEGEYFALGDNRDNSRDSRYWGTVPEDHLVGRAFLIWMHWDSSNGISIARDRIGSRIE